jgi:hypothetical protein
LPAGSSPLVGPLGESSNLRTGSPVQPLRHIPVTFLPRTLHPREPIPLPYLHPASPGALPVVRAQSFLAEIPRVAHITGSPLLPAPYKAKPLPSCITRRASLLQSEGSLGIPHLGASPGSPWPLAYIMLSLYSIGDSTPGSIHGEIIGRRWATCVSEGRNADLDRKSHGVKTRRLGNNLPLCHLIALSPWPFPRFLQVPSTSQPIPGRDPTKPAGLGVIWRV